MNEYQFKMRTKQLAVYALQIADELPMKRSADVIGRQLVRSATSVAANYRAACRSRSIAAMIAKLDTVLEEADETLFWFELLVETSVIAEAQLARSIRETNEIIAMTIASLKTLRSRKDKHHG